MSQPFPSAQQPFPAQTTIPDAAAQEFGAPAQQVPAAPQQNAFLAAAAPEMAQVQQANPVQQLAQQMPAQMPAQAQPGGFPVQQQGIPQAQPGSFPVQQHTQNGQQMAAQAQQTAAPAFGAPQQQAPAAQQQNPGGFPAAAAAPLGGGYDPSLFGAPSAGGGGTYPKVRDLNGRLCLFVVKKRDAEGTAYGDATKKIVNYIANVAVLDGGPLYASPPPDQPMAQPELVSETVPYVISEMIIGQVGLHNRLKNDFVRGRLARHPKGELEKQLMERFPGVPSWQGLYMAMQQGLIAEHQLGSGSYFWTIIEDTSDQANQLVAAFAQHPAARELML